MPLRRKAISPTNEVAVLNERIERLERQLKMVRQAGPSALQADDWEQATDPIPWETIIHYPGSHTPATSSDPIVYYHPGDQDVGGTVPPGFKALPKGEQTVWAALSTQTQGWEYQGNGSDDNIDWYDIWLSDNASAYFGMDFVVGGGQFGDDIVFLTIKQSGIYTFSHQFQTPDLDGSPNTDFHYQTRLNVCGSTPGNAWGANIGVFPGQIGTFALLQDREQLNLQSNTADDLWLNRSWTIPLRHPNPGTERRCGEMRIFHDPQSINPSWAVRLWVVRHGDLDWAGGNFTNTTWSTGDPIP